MEDRDTDDVAAMIYSSGLTGYPMGAMLTQGNLDHNSDLMRICMDADDTDTTLTVIPCFHSFSASVQHAFHAPLRRHHLPHEEARLQGAAPRPRQAAA
ncbi:MAG: AMP-binding protein [Desulfosudis oleivorans]|nr:AMP-binding protein [Desulfosudis oleivorans]